MKFMTEKEKHEAIKTACDAWGKAIAETKYREFILNDLTRGYVEETPAQRLEKREITACGPHSLSYSPPQETVAESTEEQEKQKRHRRTKAEIEAAKASEVVAKAAPASAASTPAAPAPATPAPATPAPATPAPATPAPAAPILTQKSIQELMGAMMLKLGNTPEARPKVVGILKEATGETMTKSLDTQEKLQKAHARFVAELIKIDEADAKAKSTEDNL